MGLFGNKGKVRSKYLNNWGAIIKKYELKIPQEKYYHIASAIANVEGKGFLSRLFSNPLNVIMAIVAVVSAIYTGGTSLYAYSNYIAAALSVANLVYSTIVSEKIEKLAVNINAVLSEAAMSDIKTQTYAMGDYLTQYIVYTDYEIYANGGIYKKNRAGSESFSPSLDFDTSKGIFGKLKYNQIDEISQNRNHFAAAGNKGFFQNTLNTEFPLAEAGIKNEEIADSLENNAKKHLKRITSGFKELAAAKFNYTNELNSIMDWVIGQQVHPIYKKMINNDFLDKLKNYQRGKRANFDYLKMDDFTKDKQSESQKQKALENYILKDSDFKKAVENETRKEFEKTFNTEFKAYFEKEAHTKIISHSKGYGYYALNENGKVILKKSLGRYYLRLNEWYIKPEHCFSSFKELYESLSPLYGFSWQRTITILGAESENRQEIRTYTITKQKIEDTYFNLKKEQKQKELLNYEIKILGDKNYKQKSFLFSLEEKAKDYLENLEAAFMVFKNAVQNSVYLTRTRSTYEIYELVKILEPVEPQTLEPVEILEPQTLEPVEILELNKTSFLSLENKTYEFYTLKNDLLRKDLEEFLADFLSCKNHNAMIDFYENIFLKNLGIITYENTKFKGFLYKDYLAFFEDERDFAALKTPLFRNEALKNFDFNQIGLEH